MHILAYLLSLSIMGYTLILSGQASRMGIYILWDAVSFLFVIVAPYFLLAGKSKTFNLKKIDHQEWGNLSVKFAYIGILISFIFALASMSLPPEPGVDAYARLGGTVAIALISLLYALVFKYMVVYLCDCDSHKK